MTCFKKGLYLALILTFFSFASHATIDPAALAADYDYHEAKISPDGKHIALIIVAEGKRRLAVVDSKTFASVGGVDFGENQAVGEFHWANEDRLVMEVVEYEPWESEPLYYGELYAVDYDGRRGRLIYGYRAGEKQTGSTIKKKKSVKGWAEIISTLPEDEDYILISSMPQESDGLVATVHKLNINNGRMSGILATTPAADSKFYADRKGNVRVAIGLNKEYQRRVFIYNDEQEWTELDHSNYGSGFTPLALNDEGSKLFILDDLGQDKNGLFALDLKTGERKHIYTDENVDIHDIVHSVDKDSVYAMQLEDGYPSYLMFSEKNAEAQMFKQLLGTFQGYRIEITSRDEEGNLWLIKASNDLTAGSFYLLDRTTGQFRLLFSNYANVDQKLLSESIPIKFTASDDVVVNGYVTYPVSVPETQNVPLVVLVHGGPHSRDYWKFDREVQLLASQGYAVLRVNFRGSSGYGKKFYFSGRKQWGDRIQKDIIEGTKWVIAQGGIQADKVCVMGTSFGAYSAVQSSLMAPDLFKCAIANAGIYDLAMMYDEGDIPDRLWGKAYLESALGTEKDKLQKFSPAFNVASLKAPVLIAHGKQDRRAPVEQAEALKDSLDKHDKDYEWFVKNTETHGFYDQQNRTEYFQKVTNFLSQHLK